jgi:hypothetical protein
MARSAPVPNFAELLAPYIQQVPQALIPKFLCALERRAAQRYRHWADAAGDADEARGLRACSEREDEIAVRAAHLFPAPGEDETKIDDALPGAAAWRGLATQTPDAAAQSELEAIARLEEESATWLESFLAG